MKQCLKLIMALLCISSFVQTSAFAAVTAKCPDGDFLKKIIAENATNYEEHTFTVDSQKVGWHIESQGGQLSSFSSSFSSWEKATGFFREDNPNLTCSVGGFQAVGFLPDTYSYQSCTLDGEKLEKYKDYLCKDANSCELVCS